MTETLIPAAPEVVTLDSAWTQCAAVLPDTWSLTLKGGYSFGMSPAELPHDMRYTATAQGPSRGRGRAAFFALGYGNTPTAALLDLTAALNRGEDGQ